MMKQIMRILFLIVCLVIFTTNSDAQVKKELGIKGGLGIANLAGDISGTSAILNYGIGTLTRFNLNPIFSLQSELSLILKGTKTDGNNGEKLKLTYLELPVLIMYLPSTTGNVKPSFFAGPSVGVLLSAKSGSVDVKDDVTGSDIGFVFGAGLDFMNSGKGRIAIDGRYTLGLSNIAKDSGSNSVRNNTLFVSVSYIFSKGK